jgi:hypothetical protein
MVPLRNQTTLEILALSTISDATAICKVHVPTNNKHLNQALMTYDVLHDLFSPQIQYFLCCPLAEVLHVLLQKKFQITF